MDEAKSQTSWIPIEMLIMTNSLHFFAGVLCSNFDQSMVSQKVVMCVCACTLLIFLNLQVWDRVCRISISERNLLTHNSTMSFVAGSRDCDNDLGT